VNAADKLGLTPLQILLAKLLDLAFIQNKPQELRPSKVYNILHRKFCVNAGRSFQLIK
jgi:hypothetical protein